MACKYYLNGEYSKLYTDLYGYMDNVSPEKKTANSVYRILKRNRLATIVKGNIFLNQTNIPYALREIKRINNKYPGLFNTEYKGMSNEYFYSPSAPIHQLFINEGILKNIPALGDTNAAITSSNQVDIDQYVKFIAGTDPNLRDYYLDELARRENTSNSKFSQLERENLEHAYSVANHLKNSFALAGVGVEVVFDTSIDNIGQVQIEEDVEFDDDGTPGMVGTPTIRINPNKVRKDTTYHEFGHIYIDLLGVSDPTVAAAIAQLKDTDLYNQVQDQYPELQGEMLDKEVLATAIGIEGAKITRKNPNKLQRIINRIFRAIGKVFGITPNQAAILAEEMFAKEMRAEAMGGRISPYIQASKDQVRLEKLVQDAKIMVKNDLYKLSQLPEEAINEEEKIVLTRLQSSLTKIEKVEDLFELVEAMGGTLARAQATFNQIMEIPEEERGTSANLNKMYELQRTVDRLQLFEDIKKVVLSTKKKRNVKDYEAFDTLEEKVRFIIDETEILNEEMEEAVFPMWAQSVLGFVNKDINPELQKKIDNIKQNKRFVGENKEDDRWQNLLKRYKEGKLSKEELKDKQLALNIEQLKERQINNYQDIVNDLKRAHRDKGWYSYYFDPIVYSSDRGIQLLVKVVQQANLEKNDMTLDLKSRLSAAYDKFAEGQNESDVQKLNEELLEEVTIYGMKRLALVNPIDTEAYYAAQKAERYRLYDLHGRPNPSEYKEIEQYYRDLESWERNDRLGGRFLSDMNEWNKNNTKPVQGWEKEYKAILKSLKVQKEILDEFGEDRKVEGYKNALIRKNELEKYLRRNYPLGKPAGDWVQPDPDVYTNKKYEAIQKDERLKNYYDFILGEFQTQQKRIGTNRMDKNDWDKYSYIMPSYRKETYDRLKEKGVYNTGKDLLDDAISIQETNHDFYTFNETSEDIYKQIPVYAVNRVPSKEISRDIASSIYRFGHMTHNFKTKNDILGQVMLFRNILKNRETLDTTSAGMSIINKVAQDLGFKRLKQKEGESYAFKHVNEWLDSVMFGQENLKSSVNIMGREISLNQSVSSLNAFTAFSTLSFNLLQGANQSILDNMTMLQEAFAGQFMTKKDLAWAKAEYWKSGLAITDIGRFNPKSKIGKAMEYFDALTEFTDQEGNTLVGSKRRKLSENGNLLFLQQAAEHELSATRMLGLMKNLEGKLQDKDGNVILNEDGSPANLYDVLIIDKKTGKMSVDPRVDNFSRLDFTTKLQGLSRRTNQIKGKMHSNMLNRRWYGKLFMLFRNWMPPGIRRRYGHRGGFLPGSSLHVDEELGTVTEGMYISFYNFIMESIREKAPFTTYSTLTEMEQQNVKRTTVELSSVIAAGVLIAILSDIDDGEENWLNNFMLYQAKRYETEILQWTPGIGTREAFRILQSPTATARPILKGGELLWQIFSEIRYAVGDPFINESSIFYQRRSGRYKKGDRKIRKDFDDLMPIFRGLRKTFSPEEAYKWFNTLS